MQRSVQPEQLDALPVADPRAIRARRDLRRINAWMGNAGIVTKWLRQAKPGHITELGAGDGEFMRQVTRRLGWQTPVTLIDRQPAGPGVVQADVFDWLEHNDCDILVANLFVHHFDGELPRLLNLIAHQCRYFVACEPRRSCVGLVGVQFLPLIACAAVARNDALISVRAGFTGNELSRWWPAGWEVREFPARPFSHVFVARRT